MSGSNGAEGSSATSSSSRKKMAYLGPAGTYGHQAAKQFASGLGIQQIDLDLVPCPTILDIYRNEADYLVMPLQNIIHGGVTDTIDSLLSPIAGPSRQSAYPRIIADLDLPIKHSLVARRGTRMEDIRWVRSHEQAIGQSSAFLDQHLPTAKRIPWPSTAGAAMSLLDETLDTDVEGAGAAICSASAVADQSELEVLYEGTQAINDNFTRFVLLTRLPPGDIPIPRSRPPSSFYALTHPSLLAQFPSASLRAIHTRPDPSRAISSSDTTSGDSASPVERYPSVYLVEVEHTPNPDSGRAADMEGLVYLGSTRGLSSAEVSAR